LRGGKGGTTKQPGDQFEGALGDTARKMSGKTLTSKPSLDEG